MSELNSFITKLQRLDDAYYQGKPRMKDENYDILRDQVLDLHNAKPTKYPLFLKIIRVKMKRF
jgi:NAD-dependent DNA ligase